MPTSLVFVYNADRGLFNALADTAHKLISPGTYQCNLCAITHGAVRMHQQWKTFLEGLDVPLEFLHRDELQAIYGIRDARLPAIFRRVDHQLAPWIDAETINACHSLDELQDLIRQRLGVSASS